MIPNVTPEQRDSFAENGYAIFEKFLRRMK